MANQSDTKTKPVHEVRLGRIRAAIWANSTDNGVQHNVTVSRLYKDGETWKDSHSFGRDDLPLVGKVLDRCHTWIFDQSSRPATDNSAHEEGPPPNQDVPF